MSSAIAFDDEPAALEKPNTTTPLALKLTYFHHFVELHGGRGAFDGLTTAQVCFKFVVPFTEPSGLSLVEHVRQRTADAAYVAPANWYISHAWQYLFLETLDSLDTFFETNDIADPVVWFCVFNNNQHEAANYPFSWWQSTFRDSLAAIGSVVMVLHPWKSPITLTRSWCVFEVYIAILAGATFDVAMATNQEEWLLDDILDNMDAFFDMLGGVSSEKAQATVASDKTS
ncbi:hypothetical protein ACHHYP_14296, partial [Achlya hypogyna]